MQYHAVAVRMLPILAGLLVLSAGCRTGPSARKREPKFGPPPPGYIKIVGEPVPDWKPRDLHAAPQAAGQNPLSWSQLGPRPILDEYWSGNADATGRVVSLAVHPTDGNTVYLAGASGGLWKTTDGGTNWTPKTDELSILNHGCVVLDPANPDTVYLGTGEYTVHSTGDGLFRSTDAAETFERIGTAAEVGDTCSRIAIDPGNPNLIHVTGSRGYVRSTDGGDTWQNTLTGSASDLALNPATPAIVFVGRHNDGIYKSTNSGASFVKLTNGLPTTNIDRIVLGLAPSNPNVVYAAIINDSAGLRGFYKTINGGTNWTQLTNTPDFPSPQGWYDCFVGVDPTNESIVYCGGVFPTYAVAGVIKSTDGGMTWDDITLHGIGQLHPDQHAIAFGPDGRVWVGNDGGVWRTDNGGQSWINRNATLSLTQNYNIAVHPTLPSLAMGGTQDNGTVARDNGNEDWPQIVAGDGGFLAYDFSNPARRYTTYVGLTVFRISPTGSTSDITGPWSGDPVNFIAPLVMDPSSATTLLGGTNRVWRTTNAATTASWSAISPTTVSAGSVVNVIAVGPPTAAPPSNNIYSGSANGRVYVTTDAVAWNNRSTGLPNAGVSDIFVHPNDAAIAYVSFYSGSGGRIFKTVNAGVNWVNMTGTLPVGVTPNALEIDWGYQPFGLYVGSGAGVWVSLDDGQSWAKDGLDLPNVNIGDLFIDRPRREITAGTYGRGAWRAALPDPCPGPSILEQPQPQTACVGGSVGFSVQAGGNGPFTYQWRRDQQPIPGATSDSLVVNPVVQSGSYDVIVTNACSDRTSDQAALDAVNAPMFTTHPAEVAACTGKPIFPFVAASDLPTYQWYSNGSPLVGATEFFLSIPSAYPCLTGQLSVSATNACGMTVSNPASVLISACGAGDLEPDGDVDMVDLGRFLLCYTGSGAQPLDPGCETFDFDRDDDIDLVDWCSFVALDAK